MHTTSKTFPFLLTLLLCVYACSPIQVLDQEPAENFALNNYRTFNFYEIDATGDSVSSTVYSTGIAALKTQITQQLQQRGLQLGVNDPDLLVNIGIVIKEKVQTRQTDLRTDAPRYMGQRHYSWKSQEVETGHYDEGTVTVHLVDRVQNKLVWRGVVEGVVPDKPARLQRNVADAMDALFKGL